LDDLSPDERSAVLTLVRLFGAKREPAAVETPAGSVPEVRDAATPTS
jgi:hypothetical protein